MTQALSLAIWNDEAKLPLLAEAQQDSSVAGALPQGTNIELLGQQGNLLSSEDTDQSNLLTEIWFQISGE